MQSDRKNSGWFEVVVLRSWLVRRREPPRKDSVPQRWIDDRMSDRADAIPKARSDVYPSSERKPFECRHTGP